MLEKFITTNPEAEGGGLNAFSLGICNETLAGTLDQNGENGKYQEFLNLLKDILAEPNWKSFKKFVTENKNNPVYLQKALNLALRKLSVKRIKGDEKSAPKPSTRRTYVCLAEFEEFVYHHFKLSIDKQYKANHIFMTVEEFEKKFARSTAALIEDVINDDYFNIEELRSDIKKYGSSPNKKVSSDSTEQHSYTLFMEKLNEQKIIIEKWLKTTGYSDFLTHIEKPGSWTGDMEIAALADFFEIQVQNYNEQKKCSESIYCNYGSIPKSELSLQQIELLQDRDIIKITEKDEVVILEIDSEKVKRKLAPIEEKEMVKEFVNRQLIDPNKLYVPTEWLEVKPKLVSMLEERKIISKNEEGYYFLNLDLTTLNKRLQGIEGSEQILDSWKNHISKRPTLMLSNPDAFTWYYLHPKQSSWDLSTLEYKSPIYRDVDWDFISEHIKGLHQELAPSSVPTCKIEIEGIFNDFLSSTILPSEEIIRHSDAGLEELNFFDLFNLPLESYPRTFFRNRSPSLEASPQVPKKIKTLQPNPALIAAARLSKQSLKAHQIDSGDKKVAQFISDLKYAFNIMGTGSEIPSEYSLKLLAPVEYIRFQKMSEIDLPSEVQKFCDDWYHEILYQANIYLKEKFTKIYLWLQNIQTFPAPLAVSLFNCLHDQLQQNEYVFSKEIFALIENFEPKGFDFLNFCDFRSNQNEIPQGIIEAKEFLELCLYINKNIQIQKSAENIVTLINDSDNESDKILLNVFEELSKHDLEDLDSEKLKLLSNIKIENFSSLNLGKAVKFFLKLYDYEIQSILNSEESISHHPNKM